jgi:eukaryotic-like serine/threonine-protein kinase
MPSDAEAPAPGRTAGAARPGEKPTPLAVPTVNKPTESLRKLGRYDIERKLGAGGMGAVYLARDTKLRRQVALKVLPQDKANNPVLVRRFEAEAQAAAQLRHDHIVAVYDSGKAEGFLYIAMEFVDGIDLHELVARRGTIPVKRSIEIIKQAASALQHAADHKIVHRDIKPSNLLIRRDGVVKITDLGLARSVDDTIETGITRAGTTVGTVDYMAPEQARSSKAADIRSDIYSLGCTWYHMLTGAPPYPEGSLTNKLQAHAIKPLPDPRSVNSQVTDGLVAILHRMIAKKPEDRYQTPADLLKDLETSTLTQGAFSQEIFHAIEEEEAEEAEARAHHGETRESRRGETADDTEEPAAETGTEAKSSRRREGPALPPPRRRPVVAKPDEDSANGVSTERLKVLAIVVGLVIAVAGLGWLVSRVGGIFDSPHVVQQPVVPETNAVDANAVGQAGVFGGVGPMELSNTGTQVAPVYGSPGVTATAPELTGVSPSATQGTNVVPGVSPSGVSAATAIKIPDDVTVPPSSTEKVTAETAKLPVWTVGPGAASTTHFSTLNEALSKVDKAVTIRLLGRGPFLLTHTTPLRTPHLLLAGDRQYPSLVVLSPSADGSPGRLHVQGNLTLDAVHLVIDRQASSSTDPVAMVSVDEGTLSVQAGSLTALRTSPAPLTGLRVRGTITPPRLVLSEAVLRGEFDVGLELAAPSVEALVQESLIVVGSGSAIRLHGQGIGRGKPTRLIRCFNSTMLCGDSLLDLSPDKDLDPAPDTHVAFVDSLCSASAAAGDRLMLNATGWLQSRLRDSLTWKNSQSTFVGFETLIDLGETTVFRATDAEGWRAFWRQPVERQEFSDADWPQNLGDVSAIKPVDLGREQSPMALRIVGSRGVPPGAPADRLTVPEAVFPERMAALARRPAWAAPVWAGGPPVKVDLKKTDLGQFLSRGDWSDRTVIEATGYGYCTMQPVTLSGRHVKIVFRQSAENSGPLRLLVKDSPRPATALFDVRGGALELEGLRWQVSDVKPGVPRWLVSATDASVVLRGCDLQGPDSATSPFEGVLRYETTATADRRETPQLAIIDSFLHAPGTLLRVEASDGGVFLRNSVLAARGVALDVRPRPLGNRLPLAFDLAHCTLSAQNTILRVTASDSLSAPPATPSRWFVDNCVFAPPIELRAGDASTPTLLTTVGPVLPQRQMEWWGRGNGAARELKYWLRPEGSLPNLDQVDERAWHAAWGEAHDLQTLSGDGGVLLREPLPNRRDQIQPSSFLLRTSSKGLTWAEGRPIGAVLTNVGPKPAGADKPEASSKPATPTPGQVKKKSTPGF